MTLLFAILTEPVHSRIFLLKWALSRIKIREALYISRDMYFFFECDFIKSFLGLQDSILAIQLLIVTENAFSWPISQLD